jgi:hypothetical protein
LAGGITVNVFPARRFRLRGAFAFCWSVFASATTTEVSPAGFDVF